MKKVGTVLLITRYGGLGDLIMMLPTIKALKEKHNNCKIVLRTYKDYENFIKESPLIDQVVLDDNGYNLFTTHEGVFSLKEDNAFASKDQKVIHYNFQGVIENRKDVHGVIAFAEHAKVNVVFDGSYEKNLLNWYDRNSESPSIVVQLRNVGDGRDLTIKDLPYEELLKNNAYFIDKIIPDKDYLNLIANSKIFVGTNSSGLPIAAATHVPCMFILFNEEFPPSIRSYNGVYNYTNTKELSADLSKYLLKDCHYKKIGLSMIVKNESRVIKRCLDSVKPLVDYVCISDTGSTDNTIEIIEQWLKENSIKGEVNREKWENFASNRSKSLENLRKHKDIDYTLVIDADEILKFDDNFDYFKFKTSLTADLYNITCKFGSIEYARTNLFKNSKNFYYKCVLHEYLECYEPILSRDTAKGVYNIPIQDSARNTDVQKYQNDAKLLEEALKTEKDPYLIQRYTFYLAQSYKDCEQNGKAIYWYNKRAELGGWDQEVYWSLYQVARLKEIMGYPEDDIVQSYLRAYEKCTSRIEALHNAIKFCRTHGRDHQAYMIGKYAKSLPVDKTGLFVETWMIDYALDDEFSIACYWSGHYAEGLKVSEELINKIPEDQKPRIQQNIQFFKEKLLVK
jgi:hypothetical protein